MSALTMWTVYHNPSDHPGKFVLRAFDIDRRGIRPRLDALVDDSLDAVRAELPPGVVRLDRIPGDDPAIVESWV